MATIDDKVVAMSFESSKFEQGVDKTLHSLKKLQDALRFPEAGKNLHAVSTAAKEIDLGHISKGVDEVSSRLGALRLVAIAVFSQIATKAISTGLQLTKALTLAPIIQGYKEYETQINAVQTILANTAAAGTNIKDVNKVLDELNTYADKTIYNFSEMARNIGTFTAAGVDLGTATASIKGIANLAAVSGSNAQQAATAMYQLSQAISAGSVKLMDWNSVVNAGMGGTVFQRALAQTAEHMGTLEKGAVRLSGPMKNVRINGESFRNSLAAAPGKEGWLSSKVLTSTLKQLSGDMSDAQLKAQGYTDAQVKAIQAQAKMALEAATQVKTFSQLMTTTREALGSGWAQTWRIIIGDFAEAKKLWTGVSATFGDIIQRSADARNKMLSDWKKLGGRTALIESLKNVWQALGAVLKPIKQAFRDIFPATTGKQLADLTKRFREFTETLMPSPQTVENLRRTFRGLFAILDIGKQIVGGIFTVLKKLFGTVGDGSGGFLDITANIGDFLVKIDEALKKGDRLNKFFEELGNVLAVPIKALQRLAGAISEAFSGKGAEGFTKTLSPMQKALRETTKLLDRLMSALGDIGKIMRPVVNAYVDAVKAVAGAIPDALSQMSFEPVLSAIRTGLLAGIFLMVKKFLGKGTLQGSIAGGITQGFSGVTGGIFKNINTTLGSLTSALVAMQQQLKAKILKDIAIAVALIAASIVALSFIDPKKLNSAMGAITIAFTQLLGAMTILGNITRNMGFVRMPFIAATLVILAGAINVLSLAVIALSFLSWEQLAKGLSAIGIMLAGLVLATAPLAAGSFGMIKAAVAMNAIAVALNLLAAAVFLFGSMDLTTLGKGLGGIAIALVGIAGAMRLMPKTMVVTAAGLVVVGVALNLLAGAVFAMSRMSLTSIGKGLGGIAGALIAIAVAMKLMPKTMALQAAGLLILAVALQGIAAAVKIMGSMSFEELAKGLGSLAIALGVLAGGLYLMSGTIAGAVALGIASAAIMGLATALKVLSTIGVLDIVKALGALAVAMALIGGVAYLLAGAAPGLLAFGAGLLLVGAGVALVGIGVAGIGIGIAALVVGIASGVKILISAIVSLQEGFVKNAKLFVLGILEIVQAFADTAPQFVDAIIKIIDSMLDAIIQLVPKLAEAITLLIQTIIKILATQQTPLIEAGIGLILALLTGIRNHIGEVVKVALEIVANFLKGIAKNITKVTSAAADVIVAFIKGITKSYAKIITAAVDAIAKFIKAIVGGYGKLITTGADIIVNLVKGIANNVKKLIAAGTDVIVAFIRGIGNAGKDIIGAATDTIIKLMNALQKASNRLVDAGAVAMIKFLNGIADTIENRGPELRNAGLRIGLALVKGMTAGLGQGARELLNKAGELVKKTKDKLKFWDSPASAFGEHLGRDVVLGLASGLSDSTQAVAAAGTVSTNVIGMFTDTFQTASPSKVMHQIGQDVVAGFAQGLKAGTEEDVTGAFAEMRKQLHDEIARLRQERVRILGERAELAKGGVKKDEREEWADLRKELRGVNRDLSAVTQAYKNFNAGLTVTVDKIKYNRNAVIGLSKQYDALNKKIEFFTTKIGEVQEQYGELPEIIKEVTEENAEGESVTRQLTGAEQLAKYTGELTNQIGAVTQYNATLQQLRTMGLDDKTYEMLLKEGTKGQQFADALVKGGPTAIAEINKLDTNLDTESRILGENAATNLYKAGEQAAVGLLKGLESQKENLEKLMARIATAMVKALKKKLKIRSPSEVFAELGTQSMEGMAKGFDESSNLVEDAIDNVGSTALSAMEQALAGISDIVDADPVITPILDLTQVESEARRLAALTNAVPITAAASFGQAAAISAAQLTAQAQADKETAMLGAAVNFQQNNYSPKALTDIEIYRQTKNQLSQLKSSLALT